MTNQDPPPERRAPIPPGALTGWTPGSSGRPLCRAPAGGGGCRGAPLGHPCWGPLHSCSPKSTGGPQCHLQATHTSQTQEMAAGVPETHPDHNICFWKELLLWRSPRTFLSQQRLCQHRPPPPMPPWLCPCSLTEGSLRQINGWCSPFLFLNGRRLGSEWTDTGDVGFTSALWPASRPSVQSQPSLVFWECISDFVRALLLTPLASTHPDKAISYKNSRPWPASVGKITCIWTVGTCFSWRHMHAETEA